MEDTSHNLIITGDHLDLGDSFQNFVAERVKRLNRYVKTPIFTRVSVGKIRHLFEVKVETQAPKFTVIGTAEKTNVYKAFSKALRDAQKQLRRRKRQRRHHLRG